MAENEQLIQSLERQSAEREKIIQSLSMQVAEYEKIIQSIDRESAAFRTAAQTQLAEKDAQIQEIFTSRAWEIASLFHRIRSLLLPPGSTSARLARKFVNTFLLSVKKIMRILKYKDLTNPLVLFGKKAWKAGSAGFEPSKDTVIVVSHEASRTGAPILSLNLIENLQKKYNVVSVLLDYGPLEECFQKASSAVAGPLPYLQRDPVLAAGMIELLMESFTFKFAIINSIESRVILPALARHSIPAISLIHEFAAQTRPKGAFIDAVLWSLATVFSTSLTCENAISEHPELSDHSFPIIPQGRCTIPFPEKDSASRTEEEAVLLRILRPKAAPTDMVVILGVGTVHIRKGVDLFIDCAAKVMQSCPAGNFRFVWFGKGYDPERDISYSVYLADQVKRAGIENCLFFMDDTPNIETAYKAADLLLISSRLDPLPNVAIEAMSYGLPIICFDRTTGIADILTSNGLGEECVVPYLDTALMAEKVKSFIQSKSLRHNIGVQLQQLASKEFGMEKYITRIEKIALNSCEHIAREQKEADVISKSPLPRLDFFLSTDSRGLSRDEAIRLYVRRWASKVRCRKAFPGFHPGVYLEQSGMQDSLNDPLADYLQTGQPDGPWKFEVITSEDRAKPLPPETRIALHFHVYYPDLLSGMLTRLIQNRVRPDLFVSVPTESICNEVKSTLKGYSGKVVEIQVVPHCGRDIGPFLTAFGAAFVGQYDIVGHIHTKKTVDIRDPRVGHTWHIFLLENLLGGRSSMADNILGRMTADPSIGMVFPDDPNVIGWGKNKPYAETLAQKLELSPLPQHFTFPVGTMFWTRVKSLQPLFNLGLGWQDYPPEPLPYDGSLLHALERVLPFVVSKQGFRLVLTNVKGITR